MLRGSDSIAEGVSRVKVRIQDIAERVGVSSATVSNALNGRGGVGETKLKQILSIAREMGYVFERNSLNNKDYIRLVIFKRHGLVVMDTQFFAEILEHMTREAKQNGYELLVTHINMEKDQDYLKQINEICMEDCAGIILLATEMFSEDLHLFAHTKAPLLVLDSMFRHDNYNCVVMNNYEAGYIACERLIAMGHTSIEHITASVRFNNMRDRRKGFQAAMVAHNIALPEDFLWQVTPTVEGAYRDMLDLLEKRKRPLPTAFFIANDVMAVGCVRALREKGISVPKDVSIIGMDDLNICQVTNPPLSTIRVYREDISRIAVQRLVAMMSPAVPKSVQKTEVSVTLVDRQSILDLNTN